MSWERVQQLSDMLNFPKTSIDSVMLFTLEREFYDIFISLQSFTDEPNMLDVTRKIQTLFEDAVFDLSPLYLTEYFDLYALRCKTRFYVSKELKLLLNFVWFVAERFIEPQSQHHVNFFTHVLAVSGHISTIIWLYLPDLAPEQMNVMLSDFLRMRIKPIQSCIRKIYVDVLLSLKSTMQSGWCTNIGSEDAIDSEGRLLETIVHNLVELPTNSSSSQRVALKDHLEILQNMLNLLRANIFRVPIKDLEFLLLDIEIVAIDAGLLVFSLYEDEEEKEDMAPGGVNITQVVDLSSNIQRLSIDIYFTIRKAFQSNLPRIHGLG
ncbi:hypothetical protein R3W88_030772 [Solanum pinnatisectum]|uniref:Late blight resistance protein R1A-like N-terminal domain-containing protein n=1 Tax=Solanum pinnatisectum TaxID=50273 RepID=A0AAV9LN44_9SOLN|nr:hypothetical protein R3W88_030772 [Solanum pinnatisectum]